MRHNSSTDESVIKVGRADVFVRFDIDEAEYLLVFCQKISVKCGKPTCQRVTSFEFTVMDQ